MSVKYAVIFEQAESNWAAYVPDLPGCMTTGKTLEETERNIREGDRGTLENACASLAIPFRDRPAWPEKSKSSRRPKLCKRQRTSLVPDPTHSPFALPPTARSHRSPGRSAAGIVIHLGPSVEIACRRGGQSHRGLAVHGDVDIVPPHIPSRWEVKQNDTALIIGVDGTLLRSVAEERGLDFRRDRDSESVPDARSADRAHRVGAQSRDGKRAPPDRLYTDSLATALAARLVERHSSVARLKEDKTACRGASCGWCLAYIEDNLTRDLSLRDAGFAGAISECRNSRRRFGNRAGVPVHQYVIQRRVDRATTLLREQPSADRTDRQRSRVCASKPSGAASATSRPAFHRSSSVTDFDARDSSAPVSAIDGPTTIMCTSSCVMNDLALNGRLPIAESGITTKFINTWTNTPNRMPHRMACSTRKGQRAAGADSKPPPRPERSRNAARFPGAPFAIPPLNALGPSRPLAIN